MKKKSLETDIEDRTDHLGNKFESIGAMCLFYEIPYNTYSNRVNKHGWCKERALTTPARERTNPREPRTDHLGNVFESVEQMCKFYGISINGYYRRLRDGYSKEEALTATTEKIRKYNAAGKVKKDFKSVVDHLGNEFVTKKSMCKYYNISLGTLNRRLSRGYDLERALTQPVRRKRVTVRRKIVKRRKHKDGLNDNELKLSIKHREKVEDPLGNIYNSISDMCRDYNINRQTFKNRMAIKYTKEEALLLPSQPAIYKEWSNFLVYKDTVNIRDNIYFKCKCKKCNQVYMFTMQEMKKHSCYQKEV